MPTLQIPKDSKLHRRLVKKIGSRITFGLQSQQDKSGEWQKAENAAMAWIPESSADAIRRNKRDNSGVQSYTTIQIPYTYAVLMSAHTYWTSVFFARAPIHQFSGRHGEGEMQVQAMEALISYQVDVGQMMVPYYVWLYDAGKYGVGILGNYWDRQKLHYGSLVEMPDPNDPTKTGLFQTTAEITGYVGNRAFNVSPWDFIFDPRVPVKRFQEGEFCAARCRLGWNHILRRKDAGYYNDNVKELKDSNTLDVNNQRVESGLQTPQTRSYIYEDADDENNPTKKHPASATFWEFYIELIPSEWGVGNTNFPQKWCFTITEDLSLIVGAQPLGTYHCQFPFNILESEVEGYGLYTRGTPKILEPIQQTVDWLVNTHFYNVRQTLNNQFIVDPSKLVIKDVKNSGPGFIWRLRPEAYGSDLDKIFKQVPVTDVTARHLGEMQAMFGLGERITGVNDQIMGALSTGANRKTATEVRTTTSFGVNRQKTITEYMSAMGMAPHAQMMVQNSQQFYDASAKLRRVGSFALDAGEQFINVSPNDIAGFYDLIPVDGTLPVDRMAQANLWKEILVGATRMPPQVVAGFDWARIFMWAAEIGGIKNIRQFRVQVLGPGEAPSAGAIPMIPGGGNNVVQLPRPSIASPGNSASTQAGLNALEGGGGGPVL
jgi:hypothetical protein